MLILKKTITCLVLSFLLFQPLAKAQERDSALVAKVFMHGLNDTKDLITAPLKWNAQQWIVAGAISATTGALVLWADQPVYDFANTLHTPTRDKFFYYSEPLGNYYAFAAMGITLGAGIISKNNYHVETAFIAAECYLLTGLLTQAVKMTTGRARPNNQTTTHPHQWEGPFFKGNSFFSGHTSTVFAVATVFAQRYNEQRWVPVLAYGLATLGGIQRIYDNRHWASDVFLGAAVGTATGLLLSKQWDKKPIRFYPAIYPKGASLSMVIRLE
jgi:membrane-associated phospholipid phosphatase